jgi:DNA helicase II / ATP-dependent DNA helicase PcrA
MSTTPASQLLDGLTEAQSAAVTSPASPLCILAGAGSGKTRVLTRRIAWQAEEGGIDPSRSLTLTFTRKAAGELRVRLRQLGLEDHGAAGTFHAIAYAQLRLRWQERGITPPTLLERKGQLLGRLLPRDMDRPTRAGLAAELDWAAARRVPPEHYASAAQAARREPPIAAAKVADLIESYREEKRRRRAVDFDDLLELCIRDLSDPEFARARHWRYRHLFVDEFQDVNPLQFALLQAWRGPDATLCVVGDPNQAIYAWNGADAAYLLEFDRWFPGGETLRLKENFRSTPQILAAATGALGLAARLIPTRGDGPLPTVRQCADEQAEAKAVARKVRDRHGPNGLWRRQAVLVRTNAQTALIAEALRAAQIPISVRGGAGLLDAPFVQDRMSELHRIVVPLASAMSDLRSDADDAAAATEPERVDLLTALLQLAEEHLRLVPEATSRDFVEWARATLRAEDGGPNRDAVEITTFHAAKGLEWPIVHLAGLEDGLVPIGRAATGEAEAEERRLFYVAVTRAEDEMHWTWCGTRRFGQRSVDRNRSPYVDAALSALGLVDRLSGAAGNAASARELKRSLRGGSGRGPAKKANDDSPLLRDLKDWRRSAAKAADVPAYVVFPDATLIAIAEQRPTSVAELGRVPGIGPVKLARYGDKLLELIRSAQ